MKKITSIELENESLQKIFWRWFSFSVLALMVASALPAWSADVFIDEGDGDFAATPLTIPALGGGKAPASEADEGLPAVSNSAADLDEAIGQLDPATNEPLDDIAISDVAPSVAPSMDTPVIEKAAEAAPVEKNAVNQIMKKPKKSATVVTKKKDVKAKKSAAKKSKSASKMASKKKSKSKAKKDTGKKSAKNKKKRKVASVGKFAGGKYATTSKSCPMESAPGVGDSVGTSKAARKLWVEDSGNTSYYKVYRKSGDAAYIPHDCF